LAEAQWLLTGLGLALLVLLVLPSAQIKLGASQLNGLIGSYTTTTPHYDVSYSGGTIVSTPSSSFAPGDGNNYYGTGTASCGGAGKTCTASAQGPLTAHFTWNNGGDPTVLPPPSAIISQSCTASWSGTPINGSTVSGSVANGLGGPVSSSTNGASSSSTTYTVKDNPGQSFDVNTCSPNVSFTGTDGTAYDASVSGRVDVNYTASATPIDVHAGGITPSRLLLTGQAASFSLSVPGPFSVDNTTYKWSATGDVFFTYNEHTPSHQLILLSDAPSYTNQPDFGFYDKKDKDTITVTCKATVVCPDGTRLPVTVTAPNITSVKPTASWGTNQGQAGLGFFFDRSSMGANELWNPITISVPQPFSGGQGCLAQLITPFRNLTRNAMNGQPANYYYKIPQQNPDGTTTMIVPGQGLDTAFPYPSGFVISGGSVTPVSPSGGYVWDVSTSGASGDSPAMSFSTTPLDNGGSAWTKAYATDILTTYVMYRPTGGVWVPLQRLDWYWHGDADNSLGYWSATGTTNVPNQASNTDTPPQWSLVLTANDQLYP
jgi:hypothetical protein